MGKLKHHLQCYLFIRLQTPQPQRQYPRSLPRELPSSVNTAPSSLLVKRKAVIGSGRCQGMMMVVRNTNWSCNVSHNMLLHNLTPSYFVLAG